MTEDEILDWYFLYRDIVEERRKQAQHELEEQRKRMAASQKPRHR